MDAANFFAAWPSGVTVDGESISASLTIDMLCPRVRDHYFNTKGIAANNTDDPSDGLIGCGRSNLKKDQNQ
jgi:hypothetical protein